MAGRLAVPDEVSFIARRDFGVGRELMSVAIDDFNGDWIQDLAVANFNSNDVSILIGNGNGTFKLDPNLEVGTFPRLVIVVSLQYVFSAYAEISIFDETLERSEKVYLRSESESYHASSPIFVLGRRLPA